MIWEDIRYRRLFCGRPDRWVCSKIRTLGARSAHHCACVYLPRPLISLPVPSPPLFSPPCRLYFRRRRPPIRTSSLYSCIHTTSCRLSRLTISLVTSVHYDTSLSPLHAVYRALLYFLASPYIYIYTTRPVPSTVTTPPTASACPLPDPDQIPKATPTSCHFNSRLFLVRSDCFPSARQIDLSKSLTR